MVRIVYVIDYMHKAQVFRLRVSGKILKVKRTTVHVRIYVYVVNLGHVYYIVCMYVWEASVLYMYIFL